jgi:carbon monoxide dehydrogenase subunit G
MLTIESKTGKTHGSQKQVYDYVTDFRNFAGLLPQDKMNDLEIAEDRIHFGLQGLGTVGLMINEKIPHSRVTIGATENSSADFTFIIHLEDAGDNKAQVKLNLKANLNMFLEMMAKQPLQQFVDLVVDKLAEVKFEK